MLKLHLADSATAHPTASPDAFIISNMSSTNKWSVRKQYDGRMQLTVEPELPSNRMLSATQMHPDDMQS